MAQLIEQIGIDAKSDSKVATVRCQAKGGNPGMLILEQADGTPHWLWVDSNDDLRIHTSEPSTPDSDGVVVGTQT